MSFEPARSPVEKDPAKDKKFIMPAVEEKKDMSLATFIEVAKIIVPGLLVFFTLEGKVSSLEKDVRTLEKSVEKTHAEYKLEAKRAEEKTEKKLEKIDEKLEEIKEIVIGWKKKEK